MKTLHLPLLTAALMTFALPIGCGSDDGNTDHSDDDDDHADHGHDTDDDDHADHGHDDDDDDDHGDGDDHDDHGHDDDHGDGDGDDHDDHGHDDEHGDGDGDHHEDLCDDACAPFDGCGYSTADCLAFCESGEAAAEATDCEHEWEELWHCVEELDSCDDRHDFDHGHGAYPCMGEVLALDTCLGD